MFVQLIVREAGQQTIHQRDVAKGVGGQLARIEHAAFKGKMPGQVRTSWRLSHRKADGFDFPNAAFE